MKKILAKSKQNNMQYQLRNIYINGILRKQYTNKCTTKQRKINKIFDYDLPVKRRC